MQGTAYRGGDRPTDHRNLDLSALHVAVARGTANGRIIWQPRLGCWITDKRFAGVPLPDPFNDMTKPEMYRELGCSARIYEYNQCFRRVDDPRVHRYTKQLSENRQEQVIQTPVGTISTILEKTPSSPRMIGRKRWMTCEEDMKVAAWVDEHTDWEWDQDHYDSTLAEWGTVGAPTMFLPRVNVQHLYINQMGVEAAIYAMVDYPETVARYFQILDELHDRLIDIINESPIEIINFGDNLHGGTLSPELFEKYVLPSYLRRSERLHAGGKFVHSHWDGDTGPLLPFAKHCGLDGIEAITPKPQGDVTLDQIKAALGDDVFLIDGIAAVYFDDLYPLEDLLEQTRRLIELFAPKLILGISDEISSTGNIDRVRAVSEIVDDYNASL